MKKNILQEKSEELVEKIWKSKPFQKKWQEYEKKGKGVGGAKIHMTTKVKDNGDLLISVEPVYDPYKYVVLSDE